MKVIFVGLPTTLLGGAEARAYNTLKQYSKMSIDIFLYIPISYLIVYANVLFSNTLRKELLQQLNMLQKLGIHIDNDIFDILDNFNDNSYKPKISIKSSYSARKIMNMPVPAIITVKNIIEFEKKFIKKYINSVPRVDIIYSSLAESLPIFSSGMYLKHIIQDAIHITLLHQALYTITFRLEPEPLYSLRYSLLLNKIEKVKYICLPKIQEKLSKISFSLDAPFNYEGLLKWSKEKELLNAIFVVSKEPFNYIKFNKIKIPVHILKPGNAFNNEIIRLRNTRSKKDYAIYFSRLTPEKGILEIPLIWYIVSKYKPSSLIIAGRFYDSSTYHAFKMLLRKFGIEEYVIYKGYIRDKQELYRLVADARVLIYPSHYDGFSLVVLESLALGTSVVAYKIPALSDIYGSLPSVKLVQEGKIDMLAKETIKLMEKDLNAYSLDHEQTTMMNFLKMYSGWENVVKSEINLFERILRSNNNIIMN